MGACFVFFYLIKNDKTFGRRPQEVDNLLAFNGTYFYKFDLWFFLLESKLSFSCIQLYCGFIILSKNFNLISNISSCLLTSLNLSLIPINYDPFVLQNNKIKSHYYNIYYNYRNFSKITSLKISYNSFLNQQADDLKRRFFLKKCVF